MPRPCELGAAQPRGRPQPDPHSCRPLGTHRVAGHDDTKAAFSGREGHAHGFPATFPATTALVLGRPQGLPLRGGVGNPALEARNGRSC